MGGNKKNPKFKNLKGKLWTQKRFPKSQALHNNKEGPFLAPKENNGKNGFPPNLPNFVKLSKKEEFALSSKKPKGGKPFTKNKEN